MARHFSNAFSEFNAPGFIKQASDGLDLLELKERSSRICSAMKSFLPDDFKKSAKIIKKSLAKDNKDNSDNGSLNSTGISEWAIMPVAEYVGLHGREHFELGMELLKEMTPLFSSEFGIRFFLLENPQKSLSIIKHWLGDSNSHVRRLASEGTRPRLPWAMRLPMFIEDPGLILPLLETLKDDKSEYVRRSVANNLNDISKDHPELVAEIAERWLKGADANRKRLIHHACRSLIKQGHRPTLKALGYGRPLVELKKLNVLDSKLKFGEELVFEIELKSTSNKVQDLIIDYAIHHQKANGKLSPKVFKWKKSAVQPNELLRAGKRHAMKSITTRKYYAGLHQLEILVNGVSLDRINFELII